MSIKLKLVLNFLFMTVAPMLFIGVLIFSNAKEGILKDKIGSLAVIADLKVNQIEEYFEERKGDIVTAQGYLNIRKNLPVMVQFAGDRKNPEYLSAKAMLDSQLKIFQNISGYKNVLLVSPEGKVVYESDEGRQSGYLGNSLPDGGHKAFEEGKKAIYISDVCEDKSKADEGHLWMTAPAHDFDGNFVGVIALKVGLEAVFKLIQNTAGLGETGETSIAKRYPGNGKEMAEGKGDYLRFLNPLRHEPQALAEKIIFWGGQEAIPAQKAATGQTGEGISVDYRGKEVVAAWRYIPSLDWGLVAKIDTDEAFAFINELRNLSCLMVFITLCLLAVFAFSIAKLISAPLTQFAGITQAISQGNLDIEVPAVLRNSKDEVAIFAETFEQMRVRLKESYRGLEKKVQEKTRALAETLKQTQKQNQVLEATKKAMLNLLEDLDVAKKDLQIRKEKLEEQKIYLEQANRELDSFVYTVSHDLRAPLRGIASFSGFIEEDYAEKLDAQGKDYLQEIRKGANRMSQLIEDLLKLSRISRIKNPFEEVDIAKDILPSIRERLKFDLEKHKVDWTVQEPMPKIGCDRIKIAEVFLNLIQNAIKFSSKNNPERPKIEIGYGDQGDAHRFYVKDNGIGIDPRYQEKIFGIFQRLHTAEEYEGTGAGLSIVKKIVEDHEGRMGVDSAPGAGATFWFSIPKNLMTRKKRLGEILVEDGLITQEQLKRELEKQEEGDPKRDAPSV